MEVRGDAGQGRRRRGEAEARVLFAPGFVGEVLVFSVVFVWQWGRGSCWSRLSRGNLG